ncbi:MAG: hypothetical protein Q9170_003692 [Blastenia crenularia]
MFKYSSPTGKSPLPPPIPHTNTPSQQNQISPSPPTSPHRHKRNRLLVALHRLPLDENGDEHPTFTAKAEYFKAFRAEHKRMRLDRYQAQANEVLKEYIRGLSCLRGRRDDRVGT